MGQSLEFGPDGEEDIGFEGAGDDLAPALVCDSEENKNQNAGSHHDTVSQQVRNYSQWIPAYSLPIYCGRPNTDFSHRARVLRIKLTT